MPEALVSAAPPRLVPEPGDIQHGYELPCEERRVHGASVRLFTFPEGNQEPSRTVVCLPGLGASGRSFAPMRPLASDWRLWLWTPPSQTPLTHTPLQWNVDALARPEAGLPERFALVGSSFGSLIALSLALEHPERLKALVLVSPVASVQRIRRGAVALSTLVRIPKPFAYLFAPTVARIMGGRYLPAEGRAEIVREGRRLSPLEMLRRLKDILAARHLEELGRLKVPTLILHGGRDKLVPLSHARDVAARIPGARLEVLREASHLPYMSHTDAFNAFVDDFLRQHAA
ncbi:alpha/beta fold hydrolase [Cystobacter ferrugineus]|uniref:Alpha/beta hydrolase n=1 Tax=Cystobacter ferrugineus TaxID=83449 RepID=A0A1L9B2E7_9BACT|nr:alpha/beta hydrolase [Cystobacter ferrugineus]OJH36429.1 alpha/beta hydrolase [Cystobacter ferrugineus]